MALNTHQVTAVKNEIRLVKPLAPCFTSSKWHCGGGRFAVAAGVCVWTVAIPIRRWKIRDDLRAVSTGKKKMFPSSEPGIDDVCFSVVLFCSCG